jgi:hypothetical protein
MQFLEYLESIQVEESGALLLVKECGGARLRLLHYFDQMFTDFGFLPRRDTF